MIRVADAAGGFTIEQARPASTQVWTLDNDRLAIGRRPSSDILLNDPEVSRHHADLVRRGGEWWVVDANSVNGTYVNGARAGEARLRSGDRIGIGSTELVLRRPGEKAEASRGPTVPVRPGRRQKAVLHLEPKRAAATIGYVVLSLLAIAVVVAALAYRTDAWPQSLRPHSPIPYRTILIAAAIAGFIALLSISGVIVNGRRWHIARLIERLSEDPALASVAPDMESSVPSHRTTLNPPQLDVRVIKPRKLPKPPQKLRVTLDRNVVGHRPLQIVYLRLFENQPRMRTFIQGAWREFGYVHFLRSASSVTPAEYRWGKKTGDFAKLFINSSGQLVSALDGSPAAVTPKGRRRFTTFGATTIRVRDWYGSYPVRALLCHGAFWKAAVDMLLDRADLVALDLSGFTPENLGTSYELQRVVDRVPIDRVVFLADPRSNQKFVIGQLQAAWSQMTAESPNAGPGAKLALVVVTDVFARRQSGAQSGQQGQPGQPGQQGQQGPTQVRLVARRWQTRRVGAMAQGRIKGSV
jgi:pSer/pThr/pTyr-binding forkhead associated (FHA) protein